MLKDIALLGIANILYRADKLDDALTLCDMALESDNTMVATHFTTANIYATKVMILLNLIDLKCMRIVISPIRGVCFKEIMPTAIIL